MGENNSKLLFPTGAGSSDEIAAEISRRKRLQMEHHLQVLQLMQLIKHMGEAGADSSDSDSDSDSDAGTSVVNREVMVCGVKYRLLKLLGRGGFSKVYECLDPKNKRRALKCVDFDGTRPEILESYQMEVKLLMGLDKCHRVIHVLGAEHQAGDKMLYAVMERGEIDLENYFRKGNVDPLKRKFYWKEMLLAVEHLHKKGIVHADLKPSNFVLVEGTLKLIDLGLARLIRPKETSITCDTMAGTVDFISPEAFLERDGNDKIKIGTFSDIWSLGCILYSLLYGRTPFEHFPTIMLKLRAIASPTVEIHYKPVGLHDLLVLDNVKMCLQRDFTQRATIDKLLNHRYLAATGDITLTHQLIEMAKTE